MFFNQKINSPTGESNAFVDQSIAKVKLGRLIQLVPCALVVSLVFGLANLSLVANANAAQRKDIAKSGKNAATAKNGEEEPVAEKPEEPFVPDFVDEDFAGSEMRAWEYRPYLVAVWFCLDGSPAVNSIYKEVAADVTRRSELLDPSGWDITTGLAPAKWRFRFLNHIESPEKCGDVVKHPAMEKYDKLMVVCLNSKTGLTHVRIREFDVQTQQWGPLVERKVSQKHQLGQNVIDAIQIAFMPLARIDRVQELVDELPNGNTKKARRSRDANSGYSKLLSDGDGTST